MSILKSELKSQEYRRRAQEALVAAEGAVLGQMRERHLQASTTWSELAEAEEAHARRSRVLLEAAAARAEALRPEPEVAHEREP
jgi:hypothetical protein